MKAKPINVILIGASGNMGQELKAVLADHPNASLLAGIGASGGSKSHSFSDIKPNAKSVVIDFSRPKEMRQALAWCVTHKVPFVSGTTGISTEDHKALAAAARKIPVLWAPNMSLGMQIYLRMLKAVAEDIGFFDLQVEETHHKNKQDAPSGTAKLIQETLQTKTGRTLPPVVSIRGGGVYGIHTTQLLADEETITVTHTALSRRLFARGAVEAAIWLKKQTAGLYNLSDVVGV